MKIFKYDYLHYNIYYKYKVTYHNYPNGIKTVGGEVLKSDCSYFGVGFEYVFILNYSIEITEDLYNKIVVFE